MQEKGQIGNTELPWTKVRCSPLPYRMGIMEAPKTWWDLKEGRELPPSCDKTNQSDGLSGTHSEAGKNFQYRT